MLGAFLAQAVAGQRVALGRMQRGLEYLGTFDGWNMLYLLGGTAAGVQCLIIHICNWTWKCRTKPSFERQEAVALVVQFNRGLGVDYYLLLDADGLAGSARNCKEKGGGVDEDHLRGLDVVDTGVYGGFL